MNIKRPKDLNKWIIRILILVAAVFVYANNLMPQGDDMSPEKAKLILERDKNSVLLDVRTPEEYEASHIRGSLLVPLDELQQRVETVIPDKDTKVFVYCRSGNRSKTAVKLMKELGYKSVRNVGGIIHWPFKEDIVTE